MDELTKQLVAEVRTSKPSQMQTTVGTRLAGSVMQHVSLDRVSRVEIVEKDGAFWGNVIFDVPPGVPDVLGTPDAAPRKTREEALGDARGILEIARMAEALRLPEETEDTDLVIEVDYLSLKIPRDIFDMVAPAVPSTADRALVVAALDRMVGEIAGDSPLRPDHLDKADTRFKQALGLILARALHYGVFRHSTPAMVRETERRAEEDIEPQPD